MVSLRISRSIVTVKKTVSKDKGMKIYCCVKINQNSIKDSDIKIELMTLR